jgi:hypothetical protein
MTTTQKRTTENGCELFDYFDVREDDGRGLVSRRVRLSLASMEAHATDNKTFEIEAAAIGTEGHKLDPFISARFRREDRDENLNPPQASEVSVYLSPAQARTLRDQLNAALRKVNRR